jgi:ElaB/YqjD/DUF883 family membrane-anchored ribosome-binding protein
MNPIPNETSTFGGLTRNIAAGEAPSEPLMTSTRGHFWNPSYLAHQAHDHIIEPTLNAVRHVRENATTRLHDAEAAIEHRKDLTMAWSSAHPCKTMMSGFLVGLLCGALLTRRGW